MHVQLECLVKVHGQLECLIKVHVQLVGSVLEKSETQCSCPDGEMGIGMALGWVDKIDGITMVDVWRRDVRLMEREDSM